MIIADSIGFHKLFFKWNRSGPGDMAIYPGSQKFYRLFLNHSLPRAKKCGMIGENPDLG